MDFDYQVLRAEARELHEFLESELSADLDHCCLRAKTAHRALRLISKLTLLIELEGAEQVYLHRAQELWALCEALGLADRLRALIEAQWGSECLWLRCLPKVPVH